MRLLSANRAVAIWALYNTSDCRLAMKSGLGIGMDVFYATEG